MVWIFLTFYPSFCYILVLINSSSASLSCCPARTFASPIVKLLKNMEFRLRRQGRAGRSSRRKACKILIFSISKLFAHMTRPLKFFLGSSPLVLQFMKLSLLGLVPVLSLSLSLSLSKSYSPQKKAASYEGGFLQMRCNLPQTDNTNPNFVEKITSFQKWGGISVVVLVVRPRIYCPPPLPITTPRGKSKHEQCRAQSNP